MQKAFLFDMDGVLINSELMWHLHGQEFLYKLYGVEVLQRMGETLGLSIQTEYQHAVSHGFVMQKEAFYQAYDTQARIIYEKASITPGLETLISFLLEHNFTIGLVTSSRKTWIDMVFPRIPLHERFSVILSLNEHKELLPKPAPDGYRAAIKQLGASPQSTIILEDSNTGIQAGKASGAYVIGFKANLVPGYKQTGADTYATTCNDIIDIIKKRSI